MSVKLESIDAGPAAPTARLNPTAPQFAYKPTSRTLPPAPTTVSGPTPKTLPVVATASVKYESKVTYEASNPEAQAKMDAMGSYQSYKEWVDATIEDYLQPDGTIDLMGFYKASDRLTLLQTGFSADDVTQVENIVTIQTKLAPYTDSKGMVDLVAAINTGKMPVEDLKAVGFDPAEVDKAQTAARAMRVLAGENYHALNCINPDGTVDVVKAAGAGLRQELEVFGVSPAEFRNAQVLSQFRVGDSNQYDFPSAVAWLARAKPGEVQVSPTPREVADAFGYTENQVKIMVRLEQKYKTPDGYNIAAAVDDPLIGSQSSADFQIVYDSFGKEAVDAAIAQARLLNTMGNLTYDEALKAGVISSADLVTLGAFKTDVEAKKYQTLVQTLGKIQGTKYESPEGFDLVGIIRDKALSPGEVVLVFGGQPTDTVKVKEEKKLALKEAIVIAHTKQVSPPKGLAQSLWWSVTPWKEEKGETYLEYVTDEDGNKHYLKGVVAGELIAAQIAGPVLLAFVPGGIAGTGAAIGGRAATVGITLSKVAGTGLTVGFAGMGAYGAYSTVVNWNDMSNAQRGFNLGMSALAMLPALGAARRMVTRAQVGEYRIQAREVVKTDVVASGKPQRGARAILSSALKGEESKPLEAFVKQAEGRYGKTTESLMRKQYGSAVADSWRTMVNVRNKLLDAYIQRLDMERGFKPLSEQIRDVESVARRVAGSKTRNLPRSTVEKLGLQEAPPTKREVARLKNLNTQISQLERQLESQARVSFRSLAEAGSRLESQGKVSHLTKERLSAINREWATIEESFRNPKDVVYDTRSLAEAITGQTDIKALKADVLTAQKRLDAVRFGKHVSATTTFGDLALDLAQKQLRYEMAVLGDVTKMQGLLGEISEAIQSGHLRNGKPLTDMQLVKLKWQADTLAERIWSAAKQNTDPQVEAIYETLPNGEKKVVGYRTPEPLTTGGRGGVAVAEPPTETSTGTSMQRLAEIKRIHKPVIAYAPSAGFGTIMSPEISTEIRPAVHGAVIHLVNPSEVPQTERLLMNAVSIGMQQKVAGANQVEMANAIENALQQDLEQITETKLQTKLERKIKTLTKVAVKIAVKVKVTPRFFPPILPPKPGVTKGTEKEQDIPSSAAGWKQGAFYWHIWPDGDKLAKRATLQPVEGISYKEGIGSAYDTLRKTHEGKLPKLMAMDMGIMDVYVSGEGETPKMRVRQDLYRRTRLGYVEGNPSMSRMK